MTCWLHPPNSAVGGSAGPALAPVANPPAAATPEERAARARTMVIAPAVGLMVAAAWKVLLAFPALLLLGGLGGRWFAPGWLDGFPGGFNLGHHWNVFAPLGFLLFRIIPALLVFFGAYQMLRLRSYGWAIAAAIVAILSCGLLSLVTGIWALVALAQPEARAAFGAEASSVEPGPNRPGLGKAWQVALIIGVLVIVTGLLAGAAIGAVRVVRSINAGEVPVQETDKPVEFSFPLAADGRFNIDNVNGRIEITGWDLDEVAIKGNIHASSPEDAEAVKIDVDHDPNAVAVHTRLPADSAEHLWSWLWSGRRREQRVDYKVQVPRRAQLGGVSNVNGPIEVEGVSGSITASDVNGLMRISDAASNLNLSSINGPITADLVTLGPGQTVEFSQVNGRIEATIPADASASFSVNSLNGSLTSEFPSLEVKKPFPVGSELKGALGEGGASVKASSINGGVTIRKGSPAPKPTLEQPEKEVK